MPNLVIKLDDRELNETLARLAKRNWRTKEKVSQLIVKAGLDVESKAKENLTKNKSVITGRLRSSIRPIFSQGEMGVTIGTNVEYAPYVEFGTHKEDGSIRSHGKPYLQPAFDEVVKDLKGEIQKSV